MKPLFIYCLYSVLLLCSGAIDLYGQSGFRDAPEIPSLLTFNDRFKQLKGPVLRNDEFGLLDSITTFDHLKGYFTSRESFLYDSQGRIVQHVTSSVYPGPWQKRKSVEYPGKDTISVLSRYERDDSGSEWIPTDREIIIVNSSQSIRFVNMVWESSFNGWRPYTSTEEWYDHLGRLETYIHSGYQISQGKFVPVNRKRIIYNASGNPGIIWQDRFDPSSGQWLNFIQSIHQYTPDDKLSEIYERRWDPYGISWVDSRWEHWDFFPEFRLATRNVMEPSHSNVGWEAILRQDFYSDSLDRHTGIVTFMDCWPDSLQPMDSLVLSYNDIQETDQETRYTWNEDHWEPYTLHRFGRGKCSPFTGILDSVWFWESVSGIWDLKNVESCRRLDDQTIIDVDSIILVSQWAPSNKTVRYYYQDPSGKPDITEHPIALQACLFENPYQPGGVITCFTDLAYQGQTMYLSLVTMNGQTIHEASSPAGMGFVLPPWIEPGFYVLHIRLSGGESFSVKLKVSS